jgi:hypothetical protein
LADSSGFRKQDSSKRENVLFYQLILRMCIVENCLAYYWMASRLNEKNDYNSFNKGKGSSSSSPSFRPRFYCQIHGRHSSAT